VPAAVRRVDKNGITKERGETEGKTHMSPRPWRCGWLARMVWTISARISG
jgi:hypothetical protein